MAVDRIGGVRRIDCHVHYVPSGFGGDWDQRIAQQSDFMRVVMQRPAWRDLTALREVMESSQVDLGLIIPNHATVPDVRGRLSHDAYEAYNRSMSSDLAAAEGRFVAMAVVDPFGDREDIAQLERSLELPHMAGIGLNTNYGDVTLDDPRFEPIFALARDHDVPITVHPGGAWPSWHNALRLKESMFLLSGLGFFLTDAMCIFMMAHGGVFDRFPTVRFMFCQLGGVAPICCGRWASAIHHGQLAQVNAGQAPAWTSHTLSDILGHLWLDTHTQDHHAIALVMAEAGDHTVVLGGDYPVTLPDTGIDYAMAELDALKLPADVMRKIERDNGLALLGET